jgi:hypothetical protein
VVLECEKTIEQWNREESPKLDLDKIGNLVYDKKDISNS